MASKMKKGVKKLVYDTEDKEMNRKLLRLAALVGIVIVLCAPAAQAVVQDVVFYNDAVVGSDEYYRLVTVYDSPPDTTTLEFYGYSRELITHDSSTVNVYQGGSFGEDWGDWLFKLYDSSTVNVYKGGGFYGGSLARLYLYYSSTLNVKGGRINTFILLHNSSILNVYDGYLFSIVGYYDYSTVNVYGGYIDTFLSNNSVPGTATVNIYGYGFEYNPKGRWSYITDPAQGWWVSKLTGYGLGDEPITYYGLPDPATHSNINLIPEPGTLALLAMGGLVLLTKRQRRQVYSK